MRISNWAWRADRWPDFEGGTLAVRGNFTRFDPSRSLSKAGRSIRSSPASFAGIISGPGALTKTGISELLLSGPGNSYAGGTFINSGFVRVANDNLLGAPTGGLTFDGGTLRAGSGFVSARSVTLAAGGGTLEAVGAGATFTGAISGPGRLTTFAPGARITLTGNSDYAGGTTIDSGILRIGDGGTTGSIIGDVINNGSLIFNRSDACKGASNISGTGALRS